MLLYKLEGEDYETKEPFDKDDVGIFTNTSECTVYDVFDTLINGKYSYKDYDKSKDISKGVLKVLDKLMGEQDYFLCNSIHPECLKEKPRIILKKYKVGSNFEKSKLEEYLENQEPKVEYEVDIYNNVVEIWLSSYSSNRQQIDKLVIEIETLFNN